MLFLNLFINNITRNLAMLAMLKELAHHKEDSPHTMTYTFWQISDPHVNLDYNSNIVYKDGYC